MIKVSLKYLRHSPRKLRSVIGLYRGKSLSTALKLSSQLTDHSTMYTHKLFKMAQDAAKAKEYLSDNLFVKEIFAGDGPKIRRSRPNARGRANRYRKHLAHLTVILDEIKKTEDKPDAEKTETRQEQEKEKDGTEN